MEEARAQGYRHFNSKVGKGLEEDRTLCEAIRRGAPEGAFLWADANRGLSLDGARRLLPILRDLGFGALEQPLRDHHGHELALLKRDSGGVRILVDEALGHVDDLRAFIREDAIHGITLKLARMGGISPNLEALELARANGLDVLVSGLTESGVNLVAASILGAAFAVGFPAALNGPQLLAESCLIGGWPVKDGRVELSGTPGLGVEVDERALERLAREA
jgi:L-alanine-DL-glutamate epimerase-like enolase superfamily enzyme